MFWCRLPYISFRVSIKKVKRKTEAHTHKEKRVYIYDTLVAGSVSSAGGRVSGRQAAGT